MEKISFITFGLRKEFAMQDVYPISNFPDRGGRRLQMDRRKVSIPEFEPERRSYKDRRRNLDRRICMAPEYLIYPNRNLDRYMEFLNANKGITNALLLSFPLWALIISIVIFRFWF
jgi:hypothetical protein